MRSIIRVGTGICLLFVLALLPSPAIQAAQTEADWTLMVYLDADNNLDASSVLNMEQMVAGMVPTSRVNVIVLMDRFLLPAYYYQVTSEGYFELASLGEVDMGDPRTMRDFLTYAMRHFPAEHYFLDIWNHGSGIFGVAYDDSEIDEETGESSKLMIRELKESIAAAESMTRDWIDVVGFDACLMGMTEVGYELKDVADIVIASELLVPGEGWPYEALAEFLSSNPEVDPHSLSERLIEDYLNFIYPKYFVQLAAIDLAGLVDTVEKLDVLVDRMLSSGTDRELIAQARGEAYLDGIMGTWGYYFFVDLYKFADLIGLYSADVEIQTAARNVVDSLEQAIFASGYGGRKSRLETGSCGVSLYFPPNDETYRSKYVEDVPEFTTDTSWVPFLFEFFRAEQ